ncbi:hypothetical protein L249_3446 [Ophiocordyceps polyrhachis-furcata BCC 54312]|uniref:Cytochrome P450 monooxygenase n=1 Tax=Ophiocordyceps polyrhachis-furcata BCC 54312 TaxID=1330021 RepID=A0A367LMV2_9HYPO|nr:hypothetical protein L249_3446 [Ophiocordyceps polyrhachis-furcata BCC 54312]
MDKVVLVFVSWGAATALESGRLALTITSLALFWAVWTTFVYPHRVSPLRRLPEPEGAHWLLGHAPRLVGPTAGGPFREWITQMDHDGLIRYRFAFNRERLLVASPRALAEVLVTRSYDFRKPAAVRTTLSRVLGNGLLLAEGEEHRRQRRGLQAAFHFRHIKRLYPIFWDKAGSVVRAMTAACGEQGRAVLELNSWASRCTLDIMGVAGMGCEFGAVEDGDDSDLMPAYVSLSTPSSDARLLLVLGSFLPGWLVRRIPLRRNGVVDLAASRIRAVCRRVIREKRARLMSREMKTMEGEEKQRDGDMLSVMLSGGLFSDEELTDQFMTLLAAGHDTTASALTWVAYQMARHPDIQSRLRDEVRSRLPPPPPSLSSSSSSSSSSKRDEGQEAEEKVVTSSQVDGMPYLQAVCSEVLRTYSPVPMTMREAVRDTVIQGQRVPRGTKVVVSPWATNVDGRIWGADAGEFKPERWLLHQRGRFLSRGNGHEDSSLRSYGNNDDDDDDDDSISNYGFLTFLHGPRSCIGANFARAELACLVAAWVGSFAFELVDERLMDEKRLDFKMGVTARPAGGMPLRVRVVEGW